MRPVWIFLRAACRVLVVCLEIIAVFYCLLQARGRCQFDESSSFSKLVVLHEKDGVASCQLFDGHISTTGLFRCCHDEMRGSQISSNLVHERCCQLKFCGMHSVLLKRYRNPRDPGSLNAQGGCEIESVSG
uniref:Uncharacterized protein n=1 Tax=Hyaloperonospora arabidopsidis (strain Emoy2) TaxID=559515 RepID=M4BSB2_HYAAE